MDVDIAFLKSKRGILKVAEMGTLFVAFVCFASASRSEFIAATVIELLITSLLLLLYLLKLNKKFTFFFWPLVDVFNSVFADVYFTILSIIALRTFANKGTLVGGIFGFLTAGLLTVDAYIHFKIITFNRPRHETSSQHQTSQDIK